MAGRQSAAMDGALKSYRRLCKTRPDRSNGKQVNTAAMMHGVEISALYRAIKRTGNQPQPKGTKR